MFDKLASLFGGNKKNKYADRTVLVVDDSPVDRKVAVSALERLGFNVITAVDGEKGLQTARIEKPSLIILDCEMPNVDGPEMCRRLKADDTISNIPVLFLTGSETPQNVIECFEAEAANYIHKPVNVKFLASQIDIIFEEFSPEKRP